eukprot:scaffold44918_cov31-Tisochrysis_lutea.AAC.1
MAPLSTHTCMRNTCTISTIKTNQDSKKGSVVYKLKAPSSQHLDGGWHAGWHAVWHGGWVDGEWHARYSEHTAKSWMRRAFSRRGPAAGRPA